MTNDTTDAITHRPSIRRVIRGLLHDHGSVTDDLLVAISHAETGVGVAEIRATIDELEACGEIYNATGNETRPRWKVTRP